MQFPCEINLEILYFTNPKALMNYELTCKKLYNSPHQKVWKKLLESKLLKLGYRLRKADMNNKLIAKDIDDYNYRQAYIETIVLFKKIRRFSIKGTDAIECLNCMRIPSTLWHWFKYVHDGSYFNENIESIEVFVEKMYKKFLKQKYLYDSSDKYNYI